MSLGGFDGLRAALLEDIAARLEVMEMYAIGDSPIEKLLFTAIHAASEFAFVGYREIIVVRDEASLSGYLKFNEGGLLIIEPQKQLEGWRVDFMIHACNCDIDGSNARWKRLIVECDGHDFHERTKEQAARDRSRDRDAQLAGYTVMRFTGSEIWRDALGCAAKIGEWARATG